MRARDPAGPELVLDGCLNLRDLGGKLTVDGRQVRYGCLFRSDELCSLTPADIDVIAGLGIRVVFDLRNHIERSRRPNRLPPGIEVIERQAPAAGTGSTLEDQIASGTLPERDDAYMAGVYTDILTRFCAELTVIVERAVEAAERPLLFHCAAGKDRTGLTAALLLGLLGVPDETILDDYELTTTQYTPRRLEALRPLLAQHQVAEDRVRPLVEARRPVLASALGHLHDRYGGYDRYAIDLLGVAPGLLDRLRATLLVAS